MLRVQPLIWSDDQTTFRRAEPMNALSVVGVWVSPAPDSTRVRAGGFLCTEAADLRDAVQSLHDDADSPLHLTLVADMGGGLLIVVESHAGVPGGPAVYVPATESARAVATRAARQIVHAAATDPGILPDSFPLTLTPEELKSYVI